jgi:hypothetical protein
MLAIKRTNRFWVIVFTLLPAIIAAQNNGDYRSFTTNDYWHLPTSWQKFNGTNWIAATTAPRYTDGIITVSDGHTIVLNTINDIDQTIIKNGGTVIVAPTGTLNVLNGAGANDLDNQGTLELMGKMLTAAPGGEVVILNEGLLNILGGASLDVLTGKKLVNASTVVNAGVVSIDDDATLENKTNSTISGSGQVDVNGGTVDNSGTINILSGGFLRGDAGAIMKNKGSVTNEGTVEILANSVFNNEKNYFINKSIMTLNKGSFINFLGYGECINEGTIDLVDLSKLENNFKFENKSAGLITLNDNASKLINKAEFQNAGTINAMTGAQLENAGIFENKLTGKINMDGNGGKFINTSTAEFINYGRLILTNILITINGVFKNAGDMMRN